MRIIFTILILISAKAHAANYYIDNSGSDSNPGTSPATAWQTISKINSSIFSTGDSILFKRNGTWNEKLIVPTSGIIIGSYGTGNKPVITGLMTITGFTNDGNIWSADVPESVPNLNTVLIDGVMRAKGRYPNTGYLTVSSSTGKYQLTGTLPDSPSYVGAEIVVRPSHWDLDVCKITSQSGGVINYSDSTTYIPITNGGNGYFIQNSLNVLDTLGEWYFDSTNKKIYVYSLSSPNVQISNIDTLIYSHKINYVSINGLQLSGANRATIYLDSCKYDTIRNCFINHSGRMGIQGVSSPHTYIQYDTILNSLNDGIYLRELSGYHALNQTCDSSTIDNCLIRNTGKLAGMGMNGNGRYIAIDIVGHGQTITNNRVDSTGFNGIVWYGQNSLIKNNYITTSCFVKDDGGGINTGIAAGIPTSYDNGSIVRGNIITNMIGAPIGTVTAAQASGMMWDYLSGGIRTDSNTVIDSYEVSFMIYGGSNDDSYDNTIVSLGRSDGFFTSNLGQTGNWKRNIYYASDTVHILFSLGVYQNFIVSDSNFYVRPLSRNKNIVNSIGLDYWIYNYHKDSNSVLAPAHIVAVTPPIIVINPTHSDSTVSLSGLYIDAKGNTHNKTAVIPPFGSLILFKADYELYKEQFSIGNLKFSAQ